MPHLGLDRAVGQPVSLLFPLQRKPWSIRYGSLTAIGISIAEVDEDSPHSLGVFTINVISQIKSESRLHSLLTKPEANGQHITMRQSVGF